MYYIDRFYNFFMWIHLYVDVHVVISRAYERGVQPVHRSGVWRAMKKAVNL